MTTSDVLSALALAVSVAGFLLSLYVARRDRGNVRAKSYHLITEAPSPPVALVVEAVNAGHRPVTLKGLGVKKPGGGGLYISLSGEVRLAEGERYVEKLFVGDPRLSDEDLEGYFEDTLGRRYWIADFPENVRELFSIERIS